MIVVDTNVMLYFWIQGSFTEVASQVMRRDPVWVAPCLWRSEFRNVLAGYLRKKMITPNACQILLNEAQEHFKNREYIVSSEDVMQLVQTSNCSAYDCEYVALAQDLRLPLVTADKQILSEFPKIAVSLSEFVSV